MGSIATIKDTQIKVKASKELVKLLESNEKYLNEIPENIRKFLLRKDIQLSSNVEVLKDTTRTKTTDINLKLLKEVLKEAPIKTNRGQDNKKPTTKNKTSKQEELHLYLNDLRWLSNFLGILRKEQGSDVYLNDLLETCQLELPQNEVIKRNPELEARCQRLREEQQNLEYRKMTKNVDATLKHYPEDTVAYQSMYSEM